MLSDETRARLRAPVDLGAGARARVMRRVREAAALARGGAHPRGMMRPSVLGALLAASFVVAIVTGDGRSPSSGDGQVTLADTIAMRLSTLADSAVKPPVIDRERLVAAADETRSLVPNPRATRPLRRD
jgi:hypothetical protein